MRRNPVLRSRLPADYQQLHASGAFTGLTYRQYVEDFASLLAGLPEESRVLDFGCGPRGGLAELWPDRVLPYDPHVPGHDGSPWEEPWDVFFSADVFEHLMLDEVVKVCRRLARRKTRLIYLAISTRPARKTFADGGNVHLSVYPDWWWCGFLEANLYHTHTLARATAQLHSEYVVLAFQAVEASREAARE